MCLCYIFFNLLLDKLRLTEEWQKLYRGSLEAPHPIFPCVHIEVSVSSQQLIEEKTGPERLRNVHKVTQHWWDLNPTTLPVTPRLPASVNHYLSKDLKEQVLVTQPQNSGAELEFSAKGDVRRLRAKMMLELHLCPRWTVLCKEAKRDN